LWIEGKKAYAALNGMKSVECPQWRIRMAALKNCSVGSRTVLPGGGKLFGSVPPPSPQLWEGFSKYFTVTTYARNFYTKKEKEIDVDFALSAQEFAFENPSATIILVGGDRDFTPLLTRLARRGHFIEVWGWKRAYARRILEFEYEGRQYDKLTIYFLDDIIDEIGFTQDEWNLSLNDVHSEFSLVFQNYADKAEEIRNLLDNFNIPFYHFEAGADIVIIFSNGLGERELHEYVSEGAANGAVPFLYWKQQRDPHSTIACKTVPTLNKFAALDDEVDEVNEEEEEEEAVAVIDEEEWQL